MANRHVGPTEERFWSRVRKSEGCWEWTGTKMHFGYGALSVNGHAVRAHRLSWELHFGSIPEGLWVLHHCDNPSCVRPDHLFLGNNAINTADRDRKGRQRTPTGERHGSARLTLQDVAAIRASSEQARVLGRYYGVHETTILRARRGETWSGPDQEEAST